MTKAIGLREKHTLGDAKETVQALPYDALC
jgi:hypothetical protein